MYVLFSDVAMPLACNSMKSKIPRLIFMIVPSGLISPCVLLLVSVKDATDGSLLL